MIACKIWNFSSCAQLEEKFHIYARHILFSIYMLPTSHPMYYSLFIMLPPPHPILAKVRQYNHNSSLKLPNYLYIYFHTFKIQPSKVWIRLCKLCK